MFNFWPFNIAAKKREAAKREQERLDRHVKMEREWRERNNVGKLIRDSALASQQNQQQNMMLGAQNRTAFQQRQAMAHPSESSSTAYDPITDMLNPLSPLSPVSVWNTPALSHDCSSSSNRNCSSSSYDSGSSHSSDSSSSSCDSGSSYSSD